MGEKEKKDKKKSRDKTFIFRMTDDEAQNLEYLSYLNDKSKADIIREGIRLYTNLNKKY